VADPVKWFDQSQPQTLQSAVILAYLNAALGILFLVLGSPVVGLPGLLLAGAGAVGIANEKRWGYWLCLVGAGIYLLLQLALAAAVGISFGVILNIAIGVILMILLLHPMSREYQRIWFR
jgi:multisubunit Na+/H+ antiporter MnhB subunit